MGANQSRTELSQGGREITVVNPSPSSSKTEIERIVLPARAPPILTIDSHSIDPRRHGHDSRLNPQLWIDLVSEIDRFTHSRSDLISSRQSQLQEKIVFVDDHVQRFTDSYINDKHKAFARLNNDCKKTEELKKFYDKCKVQSDICLNMLNKLNFLLPDEHKLEPLELNTQLDTSIH